MEPFVIGLVALSAVLHVAWNVRLMSLKFLDVGIGIATGLVMVGSIGHERVREFTAFGNVVVLANHLMELARDGKRLLIDKLTFLRAGDAIGTAASELVPEVNGALIPQTFERFYVVARVAWPAMGGEDRRLPAAAKLAPDH